MGDAHPARIFILNAPPPRTTALRYQTPKLVGQQKVPITLSHVLPAGLRGAFAAAMLGFFISTHTTYLHTWGSILIQDVVIPLKVAVDVKVVQAPLSIFK